MGRVRLVFVADQIPPELLRIVEFLNTQMNPAEVLAVEVRQHVGEGLTMLVPRVLGQTVEAFQRKTSPSHATRTWDEASLLEALEAGKGARAVQVAKQFIEWARGEHLRLNWGRGMKEGSFTPFLDHGGASYSFIAVWSYGSVELQFAYLKAKPPFADEALRLELLGRINTLLPVALPADAIARRPSIALSVLESPAAMQGFTRILTWVIEQIKAV